MLSGQQGKQQQQICAMMNEVGQDNGDYDVDNMGQEYQDKITRHMRMKHCGAINGIEWISRRCEKCSILMP